MKVQRGKGEKGKRGKGEKGKRGKGEKGKRGTEITRCQNTTTAIFHNTCSTCVFQQCFPHTCLMFLPASVVRTSPLMKDGPAGGTDHCSVAWFGGRSGFLSSS
jgi:hypothetical protein